MDHFESRINKDFTAESCEISAVYQKCMLCERSLILISGDALLFIALVLFISFWCSAVFIRSSREKAALKYSMEAVVHSMQDKEMKMFHFTALVECFFFNNHQGFDARD